MAIRSDDITQIIKSAIDEFDAGAEPALAVPAARFVERPGARVDKQRVVRRVELDVRGAETYQLCHFVAQDGTYIGKEVVEGGIGIGRMIRRPEVGPQTGAGKAYFGYTAGAGAQRVYPFGSARSGTRHERAGERRR